MAELSSQGTEVNKNSTSYTSVVSPQKKKKKKKKKKKEKKNKERVWGQTKYFPLLPIIGNKKGPESFYLITMK